MDRTQFKASARQTAIALRETFALAVDTLRAHKLRSSLTLLGVILAVTTLVAVMSVLNGLNLYVADKVANLGANAYIVDRVGIVTNMEEWTKARKRPPIDISDLDALRAGVSLATNIAGSMQTVADVRYGNELRENVTILGTSPSYAEIRDIGVSSGRLLTDVDEDHRSSVCVIGADVANQFFPGSDPIGKEIRAGAEQYEVVGIATARGTILGQSLDNFIMMPLGTYRKGWLAPLDSVSVFIQAPSPDLMPESEDEARVIMRARRHVPYDA
jgi:putative ABC transport system permease protein